MDKTKRVVLVAGAVRPVKDANGGVAVKSRDSARAARSSADRSPKIRNTARLAKAVEQVGQERPEMLTPLAEWLEHLIVVGTDVASPVDSAPISKLTGERPLPREQRLTLELSNLQRAFVNRQAVLEDSLTTKEVTALLGTSRQTPHDRVKSGSLLAVFDKGSLRFPIWQFDANGPDGVIAGLPEVARALRISDLARINWFTRANTALNDRTPLEALRAGKKEDVLAAAGAVGVY